MNLWYFFIVTEQNKEQATEIDNASIEEPVSDSDGVNDNIDNCTILTIFRLKLKEDIIKM